MSNKSWWHPDRHLDRRPALLTRARLATQLRLWFGQQDFLEIDPTALAASPGNEAHLHGFATTAIGNDGAPQTLYLHTSPEFAMKKLLAAGEERIFALTHVWRNRERGPRHHPEFTMLEWYRVGEPYTKLMEDCLHLMQMAATIAGTREFRWGEALCNPFEPPERLGVTEALKRYADIDLMTSIRADGKTEVAPLAAAARARGLRVAEDDTWSDLLSALLVTHVEPHLGMGRPTILDRYPAAEAALARRLPSDPRLAERFELYACGVELANGFGELTDAQEQRKRFEAEMDEKERVYGERYPLDEDLLQALTLMPPASGVALGFDRLVMLATHAPRIDDVIWTPMA